MKKFFKPVIFTACVAAALITGCQMFGAKPSAPTPLEAKAFDITTNFVPVVLTKTNVVTQTNVVNVPSPFGVPVFQTNLINSTNIVTLTNEVPSYQYVPRPDAVAVTTQLGSAVAPFTAGWGTLISGALVGLYSLWAHLRSTKSIATSSALTQEIEAIRSFILTLPQGTKIDSAVTTFMQQHQVEAGVANQVLNLIKGYSSDATVTGVAAQLQDAINALTKPS